MSNKVYEIVTEKIIEKLENGVIPWRKPWINGNAVNWKTQRPYQGMNTLLLDSGEYATKKQITDAGGTIKKEEKKKWHMAIFYKPLKVKNEDAEDKTEDDEEEITIRFLRYYKLWEINTQVEGLKSKQKTQEFQHDPIEEAERIFKEYKNGPRYTFNPGKAAYYPRLDKINVPPMKHFIDVNEYYSTLFHEMVHSTGHIYRLNREGIEEYAAFGDENYSKEELIAEIGSAMLCGVAGIDNTTLDNSASYINGWLRKLKDDKKFVVQAAAKAQKAANHILGESV